MHHQSAYALRLAVLVFYCVYAMSPIYLSASKSTSVVSSEKSAQNITLGIVWVNVLLSEILEDTPSGGNPGDSSISSGEQSRDLILIKKKRAVLRTVSDVKPVFRTAFILSCDDFAPEQVSPVVDVPQDLRHRLSDCSRYLHFGISPPLSLV